MSEPTIIKDFPGSAVESYRQRHHGFLPDEELQWIDSLVTALQANITKKVTAAELEELRKLAMAGSEASDTLQLAKRALDRWMEKYGEWSNSGPQMERVMDRRLPPAEHIPALEAIEAALALPLAAQQEGK